MVAKTVASSFRIITNSARQTDKRAKLSEFTNKMHAFSICFAVKADEFFQLNDFQTNHTYNENSWSVRMN